MKAKQLLTLRILLGLTFFLIASLLQRYRGGDTAYYIVDAKNVCSGDWGGDPFRAPGLSYLLCLSHYSVVLALQNIVAFAVGYLFYRRGLYRAAVLWWFEPVILIYANILMSDSIFGLLLFFATVFISRFFYIKKRTKLLNALSFGFLLGLSILFRSQGMIIGLISIVTFLWYWLTNRFRFIYILLIISCTGIIIGPRLYWMHSRYQHLTISTQSEGFLKSIAAKVYFWDSPMDPYESEFAYARIPETNKLSFSLQVLASRPVLVAELVAKSLIRIAFGHANLEYWQLLSGQIPRGPAWFKKQEHRNSESITGVETAIWILGLFITGFYSLYTYVFFARTSANGWKFYLIYPWSTLCVSALWFTPLTFGDSRFRLGILSILFGTYYFERTLKCQTKPH